MVQTEEDTFFTPFFINDIFSRRFVNVHFLLLV